MTTATTISAAEQMVLGSPTDRHGFANAVTVTVGAGVRHPGGLLPGMSGEQYRACLDDMAAARAEASAAAPQRNALARQLLTEAGYVWASDRQRWERDGFFAVAHGYEWAETSIHVYAVGAPVAMAATPEHPAESLAYGR